MASATAEDSSAAALSFLHPDIIRFHILPRLDGCSLAAVGCATPELRSLCSDEGLWSHICHSTWPSTTTPRMRELISTFPNGPRSFFSVAYKLVPTLSPILYPRTLPSRLISAVDIFYRGQCIFSKVHETETVTGGHPYTPAQPRRHLSRSDWRPGTELDRGGPVHVPGRQRVELPAGVGGAALAEQGGARELRVCGGSRDVRGGGHVRGRDGASDARDRGEPEDGGHGWSTPDWEGEFGNFAEGGKRGKGGGRREREEEGRRRYLEYLERKRERRERNKRREGRLDMMCVGFGVAIFAAPFFLALAFLLN
ncbi:LOW QUALITY PROTEIN: hypothetical protein Cgig2_011941 [Carnegiea gigantea]|uniref:F-box protein n=1 Tax=Carnegiea gigantea TaxID=171969 RepID=A0A9Q1GMI4_9CARY|nr:LOW QUALITY PROTEIN: hypothetical protein Cgig2_011941 [Carnegiea gigantea]